MFLIAKGGGVQPLSDEITHELRRLFPQQQQPQPHLSVQLLGWPVGTVRGDFLKSRYPEILEKSSKNTPLRSRNLMKTQNFVEKTPLRGWNFMKNTIVARKTPLRGWNLMKNLIVKKKEPCEAEIKWKTHFFKKKYGPARQDNLQKLRFPEQLVQFRVLYISS